MKEIDTSKYLPMQIWEAFDEIENLIAHPTIKGQRNLWQSSALAKAWEIMKKQGRSGGVTEKQLIILSYLVRNPATIIAQEPNVQETLEKALECLKVIAETGKARAYDGQW